MPFAPLVTALLDDDYFELEHAGSAGAKNMISVANIRNTIGVPNVTTDPASPPDGAVWLRSDLGELRYRTNGATGFAGASGPGSPAGVGNNGEEYWDSTNKRLWRSDGIGWFIIAEPILAYTPTLLSGTGTITTVGACSGTFHRGDGWCDYSFDVAITTNGTGATFLYVGLPTSATQSGFGVMRENNVTGIISSSYTSAGSSAIYFQYNNVYPGGNGTRFIGSGRYQMGTRYM